MPKTIATRPQVGGTYQLSEQDYKYGTGPLMAQVLHVIRDAIFDGERWWEVAARTTWGTAERHGDMGSERSLYIRASAVASGPAS